MYAILHDYPNKTSGSGDNMKNPACHITLWFDYPLKQLGEKAGKRGKYLPAWNKIALKRPYKYGFRLTDFF